MLQSVMNVCVNNLKDNLFKYNTYVQILFPAFLNYGGGVKCVLASLSKKAVEGHVSK
jgi:hypothetical protein